MSRLKLALLFCFCWSLFPLVPRAGTYPLTDNTTATGDPIAYNEIGVVLKSASGIVQPRMAWGRFSQEGLKNLAKEAKNPKDAAFVEPFIDEILGVKTRPKGITIRPVEPWEQPTGRTGILAVFSSPLGLMIFAILYGANIYAATEIARFRQQAIVPVGIVSAVVPVLAPIVFLCLPPLAKPAPELAMAGAGGPRPPSPPPAFGAKGPPHKSQPLPPATPIEDEPGEPQLAKLDPVPETPMGPLPPPQIFAKGEYTFNRRFFESKLPSYFRLVPSDSEKDMVLSIKAARGQFSGRYISRINQTELWLQVFKNNVTADEMIPFIEIQEVSVRHKDSILSRH